MKKYYRLIMNFTKVYFGAGIHHDYGYIHVLPLKTSIEKNSIFGKRYIPAIEYSGRYTVIASLVDDHFEDIVCNKTIEYDPSGIRDITVVSKEELESCLDPGLSCSHFYEIDPSIADYYEKMIKGDPNILKKYVEELNELENKGPVLKELIRRETPVVEEVNSKKRLRKISA